MTRAQIMMTVEITDTDWECETDATIHHCEWNEGL